MVVAVVVLLRLAGLYTMNIFDDAFITFRHVENLVTGFGLVFNRGETVLGLTTPLFAMLLAIPRWLGCPVSAVALVTGVAADAVSGLLIYRVLRRDLGTLPAIAAVTVFAVDPHIIRVSVGGMESSAFVASSLITMHLLLRGRPAAALLLAAATIYLRPEGVLLLAAAAVGLLFAPLDRRRKVLCAALACLVVAAPALVIRSYYGAFLPHSMVAKATMESVPGAVAAAFFWPEGSLLQKALTLVAPIALAVVWRRSAFLRVFAVWVAVYVSAYLWRQPVMWTWYAVPVYVFKAVIAGAALGILVERYLPRLVPRERFQYRAALIGSSAFALALVFVAGPSPVRRHVYEPMKDWCEANTTGRETIAAGDIGAIGYYCNAYIIDLSGLVWPPRFERHLFNRPMRIVEIEKPDFILAEVSDRRIILFDPERTLGRMYRPIVRFSRQGLKDVNVPITALPKGWQQDYVMFARNDYIPGKATK
jgi:hypothetical protein